MMFPVVRPKYKRNNELGNGRYAVDMTFVEVYFPSAARRENDNLHVGHISSISPVPSFIIPYVTIDYPGMD